MNWMISSSQSRKSSTKRPVDRQRSSITYQGTILRTPVADDQPMFGCASTLLFHQQRHIARRWRLISGFNPSLTRLRSHTCCKLLLSSVLVSTEEAGFFNFSNFLLSVPFASRIFAHFYNSRPTGYVKEPACNAERKMAHTAIVYHSPARPVTYNS